LQQGFRHVARADPAVRYFDSGATLLVGDEPLHLVHAPKYSHTDTMVIFRGAACTGERALNTVRALKERVPVETRLRSCARMIEFVHHRATAFTGCTRPTPTTGARAWTSPP
jgi:hypothetical protein